MRISTVKTLLLITPIGIALLLGACVKQQKVATKIPTSSAQLPSQTINNKKSEDKKTTNKPAPIITTETVLAHIENMERARNSFVASVFLQEISTVLQFTNKPRLGKLYYCQSSIDGLIIRLDLSHPDNTTVITNEEMRFYQPDLRELTITRLEKVNPTFIVDAFFSWFSASTIRSKYNARYLQEETIEGETTSILQLTPKVKSPYKSINIWISQTSGLPIKQKIITTNGDIIDIKLTNINTNAYIDSRTLIDKLFDPPNVKYIKP